MTIRYADYKRLRTQHNHRAIEAVKHLKHREVTKAQLMLLGVPLEVIASLRGEYNNAYDNVAFMVGATQYRAEVWYEDERDEPYGHRLVTGSSEPPAGWSPRGRETGEYHIGGGQYIVLEDDLYPPGKIGHWPGVSRQLRYEKDCAIQDRIINNAIDYHDGEETRYCAVVMVDDNVEESLGMIDGLDYAWEECESMLIEVMSNR